MFNSYVKLPEGNQRYRDPICSMYGIFTYIWVILFRQMLVNIAYMEHIGIWIYQKNPGSPKKSKMGGFHKWRIPKNRLKWIILGYLYFRKEHPKWQWTQYDKQWNLLSHFSVSICQHSQTVSINIMNHTTVSLKRFTLPPRLGLNFPDFRAFHIQLHFVDLEAMILIQSIEYSQVIRLVPGLPGLASFSSLHS